MILDELKHAQTILKDKPDKIKVDDLRILAKYWVYEGEKPAQVKKNLIDFCKKIDKNWNYFLWFETINAILRSSKKFKIQTSINIPILDTELTIIDRANTYAKQRLLFVLLAFAKMKKYEVTRIKPSKKTRVVGRFFASIPIKELFDMAKVNVRKDERYAILKELRDEGYLEICAYRNNRGIEYETFELYYARDGGRVIIGIEDCDAFVLYYQRYKGEKIDTCSCGRLFVKRSNRQTFCPVCWKEERRKKRKDYNKAYYAKKVRTVRN